MLCTSNRPNSVCTHTNVDVFFLLAKFYRVLLGGFIWRNLLAEFRKSSDYCHPAMSEARSWYEATGLSSYTWRMIRSEDET